MKGPTHALGGAVAVGLFIVLNIPHQQPIITLSAISALSALVPDMDNSESTIENLTIAGIRPFAIPAYILDKLFKHRGFLHSLLAVALLTFVLLGFMSELPKDITLAILLGYLSHLILDGLTPAGIPWFYPSEWRPSLLPNILCITTGSMMENVFFIFLMALYVVVLSEAGYIILPN